MNQTEQTVGSRIKRICNAMDRKRTRDLEDLELTSSQGMVLCYLVCRQDEDVCPGDVGKHFGMTHPTVTGILQRLEAKGFLTYGSDGSDRRRKRLILTPKALDCFQRIHARFLETEELLTAGMEPRELAELIRQLDGIISRLDAGCGACGSGEEEAGS